MIRTLVVVLLALPLLSIAPARNATAPTVYTLRLAVQTSAPLVQPCNFETAPARLEQQISDPAGIPFGLVRAWSCSGDSAAVIAELNERATTMQAEAAAYRAAHPIRSTK